MQDFLSLSLIYENSWESRPTGVGRQLDVNSLNPYPAIRRQTQQLKVSRMLICGRYGGNNSHEGSLRANMLHNHISAANSNQMNTGIAP